MTVKRIAALSLVALLAFAGCSSGSDTASSGGEGQPLQADMAYDSGESSNSAAEAIDEAFEREVVKTGSLTLLADDASAVSDKIVAVAERAGGRVDSRSERAATDYEDASAWLTLRVPAAELTVTITQVEELGDVTDVSINTDDVTRQALDLDARITALEASTERLLDLMASADSSEALIAAEDALSARQADLESLRSDRTYLSDQVAMSTLDVSVVSERTVEFEPGGFLGGLKSGWEALVTFASATLVALGAALPWLIVFGVPITIIIVLLRRRRRTRTSASQPTVSRP